MRNEKEMLDLIIGFANDDARIRAVMMNGSRANPAAPKDIFQDYDIIYFVTSVDEFVRDRSWIQRFGELIIMQTPDEMGIPSPTESDSFAFLMLFQDGNRIDLTLYPVDKLDSLEPDSLSVLLLDKDHILGPLPSSSNRDYLTVPPTAKQFADCCNEFWWVSTYVAKGLWRRELPYAKYTFERPVRDMLTLMLQWHIGVQTDFAVDSGKCGKYFSKYLEARQWDAYVKTFANGEYEEAWNALFVMCDLFRETAVKVAQHFGYAYPDDDDKRVTGYLRHVKELPPDAQGIYE
jgi:aminoglycoside 6-adenylyltransferase